jgi:hypothetical protein
MTPILKKVIFRMSVSINGCVEGANREIDCTSLWTTSLTPTPSKYSRRQTCSSWAAKTCDLMAGYRPAARGHEPVVKEKMSGTPRLVFSRTLKRVDWQNSRLAAGSVADEVPRLKRVPGDGFFCVGELAASCLEQGRL